MGWFHRGTSPGEPLDSGRRSPTLVVATSDQLVSSEPAHQLALILAELATNSAKHARVDGRLELTLCIDSVVGGRTACAP